MVLDDRSDWLIFWWPWMSLSNTRATKLSPASIQGSRIVVANNLKHSSPPEKKSTVVQIWASSCLFSWHVAMLWPVCGSDPAKQNRNWSHNCYHPMWFVGQMRVSGIILLSEMAEINQTTLNSLWWDVGNYFFHVALCWTSAIMVICEPCCTWLQRQCCDVDSGKSFKGKQVFLQGCHQSKR